MNDAFLMWQERFAKSPVLDAGTVFDYVVFRFQNSSGNVRDLSEIDIPSRRAEFCSFLSDESLSKHVLYNIALRWLDYDCEESLGLIHHCKTNADSISAGIMLDYVRGGLVDENCARHIATAIKSIEDFVNLDYEQHLEEYDGDMPIWGDDWSFITEYLLGRARCGMSGANILNAVQQWVKEGAYHHCFIEDALEALTSVNEVNLEAKLIGAQVRAHREDNGGKNNNEIVFDC